MSSDKSDLIGGNGVVDEMTTSFADGSTHSSGVDVSTPWLLCFLLVNAGFDPNVVLFFLLIQQPTASSGAARSPNENTSVGAPLDRPSASISGPSAQLSVDSYEEATGLSSTSDSSVESAPAGSPLGASAEGSVSAPSQSSSFSALQGLLAAIPLSSNPLDLSTGESIPAPNNSPSTSSDGLSSVSIPANLYLADPVSARIKASTLGNTPAAEPFIRRDAQLSYALSILPGDTRFLAESPAATAVFNAWTALLDPHIAAADAAFATPSVRSGDSILATPAG